MAAHRHARAQYGRTSLVFAAEKGHADCVRLLLDAGADKNAKDRVRRVGMPYMCFLRFGATRNCFFARIFSRHYDILFIMRSIAVLLQHVPDGGCTPCGWIGSRMRGSAFAVFVSTMEMAYPVSFQNFSSIHLFHFNAFHFQVHISISYVIFPR